MQEQEFHLVAEAGKQRLDLFVLDHLEQLSRAQVQKLIRAGQRIGRWTRWRKPASSSKVANE